MILVSVLINLVFALLILLPNNRMFLFYAHALCGIVLKRPLLFLAFKFSNWIEYLPTLIIY